MAINVRCPKCGSTKVQLSSESKKHGCLWLILFGWYYVIWVMIKWMIGAFIFMIYDWWMAIVKAIAGKGHVWRCRKWFTGTRRIYYCHDCGYNFRA